MLKKSELVAGRGSARATIGMSHSLCRLVSKRKLGPLVPRASTFSMTATPRDAAASATKPSAPISPCSSASVTRKTMGFRSEARAARAAGFDVLDDGDAARRRGIGDEALRADQPLLLGVGDEEDDGVQI